ncbi:hypothetical protein AB0N72_18200 [Paenarthrobacter sp. NPDC089307]|uniref:hypothetical protein n=1 Tax=Paenarthrobacter sp. NPDC089307 TaxID=3155181 RepID=UPI00343E16A1
MFDKERLRAKFNAQPVWYVSDPSPEWKAWQAAMQDAARLADSPIWALTPFIETVRSRGGRSPNDWRWEREWRVQGDLEFDLDDVAMIVADTAGAPGFFDQISVGLPWVSSEDSTVRWSGGFTAGWDEEIDSMLERFYAQFLSADRAGLIWDREEQRYFCMAEVLDTWDAMEEAFGHVVPELGHVIERGLSRTSTMWCRIFDLSNVHE